MAQRSATARPQRDSFTPIRPGSSSSCTRRKWKSNASFFYIHPKELTNWGRSLYRGERRGCGRLKPSKENSRERWDQKRDTWWLCREWIIHTHHQIRRCRRLTYSILSMSPHPWTKQHQDSTKAFHRGTPQSPPLNWPVLFTVQRGFFRTSWKKSLGTCWRKWQHHMPPSMFWWSDSPQKIKISSTITQLQTTTYFSARNPLPLKNGSARRI